MTPRVFFAFPQLIDPSLHRDYNAWHMLDHLPQNRALNGVAHGERWVRTPEQRVGSTVEGPLADADYMAMYWFREPVEESVKEWLRLGNSTLEEGRRQDLSWLTRPLVGFFEPLRGYCAPDTIVTPDALPFHPHRGLHVRVVRLEEPHSLAASRWYEWEHRHRLQRELAEAGSTGAIGSWTFNSLRVDLAGSAGNPVPKRGLHLSITYLQDPATRVAPVLDEEPGDGVTVLFDSALETITPGQWDWFDQAPA